MFRQYKTALLLIGFLYGCSTVQTAPSRDLEASPSGRALQFFYASDGGKVEAFLVRPNGKGPFPLMILLHGHSMVRAGAKRIIPVGEYFSSALCYAGLAISLPGYGMTEIPGEEARELTAKVILDGISKLGELSWIDPRRVMLYGFSRGAVFAGALAAQIPHLRAVVLHSGAYDLGRLYQETTSAWLRRSLNPNHEGRPALFNVLPEVSDWTAPTLILHGSQDSLIPVSQAFLLQERLAALGKPHRSVIFPQAGHRLPINGVREEVLSFLTREVGSACDINAP